MSLTSSIPQNDRKQAEGQPSISRLKSPGTPKTVLTFNWTSLRERRKVKRRTTKVQKGQLEGASNRLNVADV